MRNSNSTHARRIVCFAVGALALAGAQSAQSRTVSIPFNPSNFSHPLTINNPLFPLAVGTTLTYRSNVDGGCEQNGVTLTNPTKHITAGVTAREVHDVVYAGAACGPIQNMLLTEDTLDWYAQDDSG